MIDKTLKNIVKKIKSELLVFSIERLKHEDDDGYYNVWKINDNFILKITNLNEVEIYKTLAFGIPKFYGSTKYYNKVYILKEYIKGKNLLNGNKENWLVAINTLIDLENTYWDNTIKLGDTRTETYQFREKRLSYLKNDRLIKAYNLYLEAYQTTPLTLNCDDLLPFNILVRDKNAYFIDFEYGGMLPYLTSFARLIAHTREEKDYIFYLRDDDKNYFIQYYYDRLLKNHNISKEKYLHDLNLFLLYEYVEWIFVYNKHKIKIDERHNYYLKKSLELANKILDK